MPKKSKFAESYWEKRRQLEDAARLKMENETIKELTSIFPDVLKQIQETLLSQADLHDISLQDLLALPTKLTQEEYRKYIDARYQELMESDDAYQEFIDEFFPAYDYAKVNRLTQIRADIFSIMTAEMMKKDVNQTFNDRLEDILQRSYSSNANALTYLLGGNFHQLPKGELEAMLNYPWTGKTFSQRLWGNVSKLEERLSNAIVNSVGAGKGMRDILATMKNDPQVSALFKREEDKFDSAIENLVRTEYAHFAVEGIKKSFADTGVKRAISWSAEDERVCSICGGMHGKEVKENESGPPYHGRCRCTLMPKMPELDTATIDAEYEALFGDLLDEFAKDGFGVKLSHPKKMQSYGTISPDTLANHETFINKLAPEEIDILKAYTKGSDARLNRSLEDTTSKDYKKNKADIDLLSSVLQKNTIGQDITVYRGMKGIPRGLFDGVDDDGMRVLNQIFSGRGFTEDYQNIAIEYFNAVAGTSFRQDSFMSTTYNRNTAAAFGDIQMELKVDGKLHGLNLDSVSEWKGSQKESEILLDKGYRIEIEKIDLYNLEAKFKGNGKPMTTPDGKQFYNGSIKIYGKVVADD
ncbi:ADP-ribosyltransferase [Enterococcus asini]|uniref:ADP-ribosyltransferase n=1 Tax=Enterococcus asini TaxID=57732 RepID=UPI0032E44A45